MNSYILKVIDIIKETEDTVTLCFKQPALRKIKYFAGQYLTLIFSINGRRYIRPYSFSSAPSVDQHLEVTVKRVPNGVVSNHIHDVISIGDSIEVLQSMGDFTCEHLADEVCLWGGGSGITPLISLAKQILTTNSITSVFLIYSNKNDETTIFLAKLKHLCNLYPKRFFVKYFQTQIKISQNIFGTIEGRINTAKALLVLEEFNIQKSSLHYICGPAGLKESVKKALLLRGIDQKSIYAEDFELIKNPKDFERIQTEFIKLKFNDIEHQIEVVKGKTILETALDAGIELPYSCQTGNCSTCSANLVEGKLTMIGLTKERKDLKEGEYLLCCSHPLSDNVYIEIA